MIKLKRYCMRKMNLIIGFLIALPMLSWAEVVVFLPQQGALSYAAQSIQDGLKAAHQTAPMAEPIRFVNDHGQSMADVFKNSITADTRLIIGPLDRKRVNEMVMAKPNIPVLALNQVDGDHPRVWEFALAAQEDAQMLMAQLQKDGITRVLLLKQHQEQGYQRFEQVFRALWVGELVEIEQPPTQLAEHEGLVLLGQHTWLMQWKNLPKQRLYTTAYAVDPASRLHEGMTFCDVPALYQAQWPELTQEFERKPVPVSYQRLVAFGADAWQLANLILARAPSAQFAGRTGKLLLLEHQIERQPSCWIQHKTTLDLRP